MLFLYLPLKSAQHICAGCLIYVTLNLLDNLLVYHHLISAKHAVKAIRPIIRILSVGNTYGKTVRNKGARILSEIIIYTERRITYRL